MNMNKMNQTQFQRRVLLLLPSLLVGVSACATSPRTLTFSQADLTRWAQTRFPMDRKMLEVLDLAAPMAEMLWRRELEREALDTPERRARVLLSKPYPEDQLLAYLQSTLSGAAAH